MVYKKIEEGIFSNKLMNKIKHIIKSKCRYMYSCYHSYSLFDTNNDFKSILNIKLKSNNSLNEKSQFTFYN